MLEINNALLKNVVGGLCKCQCPPGGRFRFGNPVFWVTKPEVCKERCGPTAICLPRHVVTG